MDNIRLKTSLLILMALGVAGLLLTASQQAWNEYTTTFTKTPDAAQRILKEGQKITIGWHSQRSITTILDQNGNGLVTTGGVFIAYKTIQVVFKGIRPSSPGMEWSSRQPPFRLAQLIKAGDTVTIILKPPLPFTATVKTKGENEFVTTDGQRILYQDIGYISQKTPFWRAFPERVIKDILIIPIFVLWALVDGLSACSTHH